MWVGWGARCSNATMMQQRDAAAARHGPAWCWPCNAGRWGELTRWALALGACPTGRAGECQRCVWGPRGGGREGCEGGGGTASGYHQKLPCVACLLHVASVVCRRTHLWGTGRSRPRCASCGRCWAGTGPARARAHACMMCTYVGQINRQCVPASCLRQPACTYTIGGRAGRWGVCRRGVLGRAARCRVRCTTHDTWAQTPRHPHPHEGHAV